MSRKRKTAGKTAKKPTFTNIETGKVWTQEEFIKGAAEATIKDIQAAAQEYNVTVEKVLTDKKALSDYAAEMASDYIKKNIPIEILEEALNKAFRTLNSNMKIVLSSVKLAA
jgi:hypothetical protein